MDALIIIGGPLPDLDRQRLDADADYFGNLQRFQRHEDMAAEPTRDPAGEPEASRRR